MFLASKPPQPVPDGVAGAMPDLPGEADPLALYAQATAAKINLYPEEFTQVLHDLQADSYLAGAKEGVDQLANTGHALPEGDPIREAVIGVDWNTWEPGHPLAADRLAGTGLDDMLREDRVTIKGIDDTTRNQIAKILEDGVREGKSGQQIAREIDVVRKNPVRSKLIAVTEINRAMNRAALDTYVRDGLDEFNLLAEATACPICKAIEAANPHPISDIADAPPIHPRCRCAASPVITGF